MTKRNLLPMVLVSAALMVTVSLLTCRPADATLAPYFTK